MVSLQLEDVCRICLDHKALLNWNESMFQVNNLSYKDSYYKYTGLEENALDPFPTNLCQKCANELKDACLLFEKALESYKILQVGLRAKELKTENLYMEFSEDQIQITSQIESFDYALSSELSDSNGQTNETLTDIQNNIFPMNVYVKEPEATPEHFETNTKVEPTHFIDIQNLEPSDDALMEQKSNTDFKTKIKKSTLKKGKQRDSNGEAILRDTDEIKCEEIGTGKANKRKKVCKLSTEIPLERELSSDCEGQSTTPLNAGKCTKTRKKNLLMCAFCSLKVDGTNQLKRHEATHSADRKRTETCPKCGIKLYTKMALNNHMKVHDENRTKNYKCEFCEKAFFNRGALNVHRRIHLGLMVKCLICSKEFYRQIDLDKHLVKHSVSPIQKNVEQLKYTVQCPYCDKSVLTTKWRAHKAAHLNEPQVKCKLCDKLFFARHSCVNHLQRFHKKKHDYDQFIHSYVISNTRMSHLMLKQQGIVKPITPKPEE